MSPRPLGVSLFAFCDGLLGVLVGLPGTVLFFAGGQGLPAIALAVIGGSVATVAASVGVWRGSNRARVWLTTILVCLCAFLLLGILAFLVGAGIPEGPLLDDLAQLVATFALLLLWTVAHVWYFSRQNVAAFFGAPSAS
mgnify:CR=1 FL=1